MPGMDGLDALAESGSRHPALQVVMISGHGTIDTAVEATRRGAFDFLQKPLDTDRLLVTLRNMLDRKGLEESVEALRSEVESRHQIVGRSPCDPGVLERVEKVAPTDARVLITGENGTGKELVARALHRLSRRSDKAFVEVNCAAIPSELIESELFGHMRGSFTGAVQDRAGTFEQADGGTLFLDEIGDMSLAAQAKVLRALEEGKVMRVGGQKVHAVDVRIIAATNKDLSKQEIEENRFREDLFYRLNVVPVMVPALRERREDIPLLVRYFADQMAAPRTHPRRGPSPRGHGPAARRDWPGNVRELRNTVERLLILSAGDTVTAADVEIASHLERGRTAGIGSELIRADTFQDFRDQAERAFLLQRSGTTTGTCPKRPGPSRCPARTSTSGSSVSDLLARRLTLPGLRGDFPARLDPPAGSR
jgi:two-component system, NtrC family, nitrogen regulation response regulator NtrX